ncbi:MAG: rod shape-determining protein MreD [Candidatus Omnitrophica bacterium]|nr:rod shape-determining protein MreD [Candidatus Omnitrophota bacterium]MCB9720645.1 rod shape-determining protein MreD [Candidatus Omnitrophota bacterium]
MRRIITVLALTLIFFLAEYLLVTVFGKALMPNLMLLLIVFLDLSMGIRYALLAAFLGGGIRDAYSTQFFGFHILTLMLTAYVTTILTRIIYQKGSWWSLLLLIFCINSILLLCQGALSLNLNSFPGFIRNIYLPEILMTLLFAGFVFNYLRKCVLKLYE